ncbi:MAG: aminoacyl-tRNA hydrolase, partial [Lachnospiraceae bacterium]|nr:aminoacyl-tRNA hydrolase [Lachnospiraceae bacterium]
DEFIRVRMGVGEKPPMMDLADYVLGHFPVQEREIMNEGARTAALAIETVIVEGPDAAMNKYNARKRPPKQEEGNA